VLKHVKAEDLMDTPADARNEERLDLAPLLGTWVNTDVTGRSLAKVILSERNRQLIVHVYGVGEPPGYDWGEVEAEAVYSTSLGAREAAAFTARYRFDFQDAQMMANLSQGLLVVATFGTFRDGSPRANYFSREFFHK